MTTPSRERGYLLIADMEGSTASKFALSELDAFSALSQHNRLVMKQCATATPVAGLIVNSLGDAVVAKFPFTDDASQALQSCLNAAKRIIAAFETTPAFNTLDGRKFYLRTKLLLQVYDAYTYDRSDDSPVLTQELVGADIDLAFRLSSVAWRLQLLVTESFMVDFLSHADVVDDKSQSVLDLMNRAHFTRHAGARGAGPLSGISVQFSIRDLNIWVTDARVVTRLKGIADSRQVFALAFESTQSLVARGEAQRVSIKLRQDHHAIVLVNIALEQDRNDNYIDHVVGELLNSPYGSKLDSEITLLAAAKIYGAYDFFFRVACIDDDSLRRFLDAVHADAFGLTQIEVRSTVTRRRAFTRHYPRIFSRVSDHRYEIVLTWFERVSGRDIYAELQALLAQDDYGRGPVSILEVGEVIHHTPVYAIFICDELREYAAFLANHGFRATACHSHVGHVDNTGDAQLRYSLMSGIFLPRQIT